MNIILNRLRKASVKTAKTLWVGETDYEVKDEYLLEKLNSGTNTIEVLDDDEVSETIDELTGLFSNCYHVRIHRIDENEDEILWEGYVDTNVIAGIVNGEYTIE